MLSLLRLNLLLVGCGIPGCMLARASVSPREGFSRTCIEELTLCENPKELQNFDDELLQELLAQAPSGSHVYIKIGPNHATGTLKQRVGHTCTGTLVSVGKEDVVLMNCISQEVVDDPSGQEVGKTNHIPHQSFKKSSISRFEILSLPPCGESLKKSTQSR